PDGVVPVGGEGDLEFGAKPIDAGNQYGILHALEIGPEESAKPPYFSQDLRPMGRANQGLNAAFDRVAEVHIHTRLGVGFHFKILHNKRGSSLSRRRARSARFSMTYLSNFSSYGTGYRPVKQAVQKS